MITFVGLMTKIGPGAPLIVIRGVVILGDHSHHAIADSGQVPLIDCNSRVSPTSYPLGSISLGIPPFLVLPTYGRRSHRRTIPGLLVPQNHRVQVVCDSKTPSHSTGNRVVVMTHGTLGGFLFPAIPPVALTCS